MIDIISKLSFNLIITLKFFQFTNFQKNLFTSFFTKKAFSNIFQITIQNFQHIIIISTNFCSIYLLFSDHNLFLLIKY
jgi:hypothetical protein